VVLERVAHGIAHNGGVVERSAFLLEFYFTTFPLSHAPPALAMKMAGRAEEAIEIK